MKIYNPQIDEFTKLELIHTKGKHCAYCGELLNEKTLCIDHIYPIAKGGSNWIRNLNPCCQSCNSLKRDHSLSDFRLLLAARKRIPEVKFSLEQLKFLECCGVLKQLNLDNFRFQFEKGF